MKWTLLLSLLFSFSALSKDSVVAEVNGKKIQKSTLMAYHTQNLNYVRGNKKITIDKSLNDLIDRTIGIEEAKKAKVDQRPDVVKKINDIIYHANISDAITPKLKGIKVSDADVKNYYAKFPEYKTSQILLRLRTQPSSDEVAETLLKAEKVYAEVIKKPENFSEFVKQYGQTANAITGGELGYQPRTRLSLEYFNAIKGKKKGAITKPFRSQFGVHIVKVSGVKEYKQIDMNLYKKIVYDTKRDAILENYFSSKRKNANVKVYKKNL